VKIYIKGNYNNSFTKLEVLKSKTPSNKVLISVHGLYGISGDRGSKSKLVGNSVLKSNLANVVQFSSSRDWSIYNSEDRELSKQAFINKTFDQERNDLIDAIELIKQNSNELFGVDKVKFIIVANSLGGTITSSLSNEFDNIEKIVLCGSGTGASSPNKPILSTYPAKEFITDSAKKFKGNLLFLQGSKDETVPLFSQQELFDSYKSAKKELKVIDGANHNFSSINGKSKKLACRLYIDEILRFLEE
jgi:dienelactone hydrolase